MTVPDRGELAPASEGRALVVGAGLIGTSIGLALARSGWSVGFSDLDPAREAAATAAVAAVRDGDGSGVPATYVADAKTAAPDFVAIAIDPASTPQVLLDMARRYVTATVIDTASVKSGPAHELETRGPVPNNIVLSHPLGGRATSGPDDAAADLFAGRIWTLSRLTATKDEHAERAENVVRLCGAVPFWISAERHDEVLAVTSHLPQLVASGLASAVADLGRTAAGLAGPALTDMTRIADSPIEMWTQIIVANRAPIAAGLGQLIGSLSTMRETLLHSDDDGVEAATTALLLRGRAGRSMISAKHAGLVAAAPTDTAGGSPWVWVEVTLLDVPGTLVATLLVAAEEKINVEDVRLDHAPHAAAGTVALAVAAKDAPRLRAALAAAFANPHPDHADAGAVVRAVPAAHHDTSAAGENDQAPAQLVALDGPSASGKSTVARRLAATLGWAYLDTGATYRAITLACLRAQCPIGDADRVSALASVVLSAGRLALDLDPEHPKVWLDGEDVSAEIRGAAVTSTVSAVSSHRELRALLVAWQRRMALDAGWCVLEGRDTGSVVVPEAGLKVWLTARPEVRASRRAQEDGDAAGADLARRDSQDAGRAVDPMKPAPDALVLDTSELNVDEIVALLMSRLRD